MDEIETIKVIDEKQIIEVLEECDNGHIMTVYQWDNLKKTIHDAFERGSEK